MAVAIHKLAVCINIIILYLVQFKDEYCSRPVCVTSMAVDRFATSLLFCEEAPLLFCEEAQLLFCEEVPLLFCEEAPLLFCEEAPLSSKVLRPVPAICFPMFMFSLMLMSVVPHLLYLLLSRQHHLQIGNHGDRLFVFKVDKLNSYQFHKC